MESESSFSDRTQTTRLTTYALGHTAAAPDPPHLSLLEATRASRGYSGSGMRMFGGCCRRDAAVSRWCPLRSSAATSAASQMTTTLPTCSMRETWPSATATSARATRAWMTGCSLPPARRRSTCSRGPRVWEAGGHEAPCPASAAAYRSHIRLKVAGASRAELVDVD